MRISVITPSHNNSRWLKLCIASVADQVQDHEHIVQDACSSDGTQDWLPNDPRAKAYIEKDVGMYDAINRGLRRAGGDILGYLNCDEQYLPGALSRVAEFFDRNPNVDVVFTNAIVVDPSGEYLCHRQPVIPNAYHIRVSGNLPILTCATFFRRRIIADYRLWFDPTLKDIGDLTWVLALLQARIKLAVLDAFTSVFTETGVNMNLLANAQREKDMFYRSAPAWLRLTRHFWIAHHRARRLAAGHYRTLELTFSLYTQASPHRRVVRNVQNPTFRWIRKASIPQAA
jgi:glycosyltransferase involved in cell wall biosynthesis